MFQQIQGSLATIKEASRRPIWEEPNLQYDGAEPPKVWLDRLKQLKQIHGYNDKETVHVAERCLKGSAQVWFRIHHPKSFEALRTGLHTRFASGPVLTPATVSPPKGSAGPLGSSPTKCNNLGRTVHTVVQVGVTADTGLLNPLEHAAKPNVCSDDAASKSSCPSENSSESTHRSKKSQDGSNSSSAGPQSVSSNSSHASVRSSSKSPKSGVVSPASKAEGMKRSNQNGRCSQVVSTASKAKSIKRSNENKIRSQDLMVVPAPKFGTPKSSMETQSVTLTSEVCQGDDPNHKGATSLGSKSISLSNMSHRISARDVLEENGHKGLPTSCKSLPINWQEALLMFKHALHQAIRGDWTQMSPDFCKYYLRCYRMRTSGSKRELIHRIRDHLELTDGSGAHKYPRNSFVINCAGVVCLGDVILFEQKLRAGFDVLNGNQFDNSIRTVVGRVVKDCKSTSSHQQVFTIEVYWSKGQRAFRPMRPLRIAANELFSLQPLRQGWINEDARKGLLDEKRKSVLEKRASHKLETKILNLTGDALQETLS